MKTPGSGTFRQRGWVVAGLVAVLLTAGGCASKSTAGNKPAPSPWAPLTMDEMSHRQEVAARAAKLMMTGKYQTTTDARLAAEREINPTFDPQRVRWEQEQKRWQEQAAEQDKFLADWARTQRKD